MKTIALNRRRGWLARRRIPREIGPAEDTGQDPDELPIDDYWESPAGTPISFVSSELFFGPYERGLPITELGSTLPGKSVGNFITKLTRACGLQRLEELRWYLDCEYSHAERVSEMRQVALELWEAQILRTGHSRSLPVEETKVLSLLLITRPLWLRSLADWRRPSGSRLQVLIHLAEHLLAQYPAPEWLQLRNLLKPTMEREYCYPHNPYHRDAPWEVAWPAYIASIQGFKLGPVLHLCASACGIDIPASSARFVFEVPPTDLPLHGFQWLLIRVNGGSPDLATRLAGVLPAVWAKWLPALIRIFIKAPELIEHAQLIVESILHQYAESQRTYRPKPFQLAVRSPARILKEAVEYHESRVRSFCRFESRLRWKSHGWDANLDHEGQSWSIKELLDSLALYEESKNMRHCVASYAKDCERGRSAIFSVTIQGRRMVTVEVNPKTRRVVQVHGYANRMPTPQESRVVNRWCAKFNLVLSRV